MAHLRRRAGLLDEGAGDVLEHRRQVQFLLVMPAQGGKRLLAGDGEHRHMVHARIVEAGQQVRGAGAGGGDADAQAAISSWRAWMNLILPLARLSAPNTPLMPSPG